jgi:N-methylhydantoinase A
VSYRVGVDIGGTFTDLALLGDDDGVVLEKTLSTPNDRSLAVMQGLEKLAARVGSSFREFLGQVETLVHSTTVADNTLIEMNGAVTGLLTTAGFRDELELRRGYKEDIWDVRLEPPPPIVPRRRRLTVPERILADGSVMLPLDEEAARLAIARLAKQGVESVAIATLFSFLNPVHEERLVELVAEALPEVDISVSHRVLPKAPEFERTSTTVVNAYVGPRVSGYLDRLAERLAAAGYRQRLLLMQSSGVVMTRDYLRSSPVRVLASGPAGGVIGGSHVGVDKGEPDLLCVDMGGTSYDVSIVRHGKVPAESGWNWHHRYMIGTPMIAVETLGAGGGSICQVRNAALEVGPESAGADPGPVCYGRGGARPTITDANLILGLLSDQSDFAGGSFRLTRKDVDQAFREQVADPLGCGVEQAAFDSWRVVNARMTQAIRRLTAEKGTDPADLTMLAYGGNGPVFAAIQAQELGIARVLVPKASPAFSALGTLTARPGIDEERSYLAPAHEVALDRLCELWRELDERAERNLKEAGFTREDIAARYQLTLRYPGQNWSLAIDVAESRGPRDLGFATEAMRERVIQRFHERHLADYGHSRLGESPEITGVRLTATVEIAKPSFVTASVGELREPSPAGLRRANLGRGFEDAKVFRAVDLRPGDILTAPSIVEEDFTTIVVYPGWRAHLDGAGDYLLERA